MIIQNILQRALGKKGEMADHHFVTIIVKRGQIRLERELVLQRAHYNATARHKMPNAQVHPQRVVAVLFCAR